MALNNVFKNSLVLTRVLRTNFIQNNGRIFSVGQPALSKKE